MSIALMSRAWAEGPEEPSHKLVFLAICDHANDDGVCWPSMARIAKKCCLSDRQTRRIVRILEKRGLLLTQQSEGHSSNRYLVQFPTRTPMTGLDDKEPGHTGPTTRTPMTGDPDIAMSDKSSVTINRTIIPPIVPQGDVNAASKQDQDVESLYSLYPRKIGKGSALKAIRKALKSTDAEVLREAVGAYAEAVGRWPKEERQFVPHPSTWFNSRRWEDDRSEWERKPKPPTNGLPNPHVPTIRFA